VFRLVLLYVVLVAFLKVFGQHDVAILSHGLHARLLANGVDICTTDAVGSGHIILLKNIQILDIRVTQIV
jgi:hypothetical protein